MIDTIRIKTHYISDEDAEKVKSNTRIYQTIDGSTGMIIKSRYNTRLNLSTHHYSVFVMVCDTEFQKTFLPSKNRKVPEMVHCPPYLIIECSLAKFLQGHNVYGGTDDLKEVKIILDFISDSYGINKLNYEYCSLERIDISYCYKLNDVNRYLGYLKKAYYPRREEITRSKTNSLYIPGSTTTIKFYDKYKEYKVHDYKKTKNEKILNAAYNVLRVEVEVKKRKLREMFNNDLRLKNIDMKAIILKFDEEVLKIYNRTDTKKPAIRHENVYLELTKVYGQVQGTSLYSTYMLLIENGKDYVRNSLARNTFYRHMRMLKDLNINIFAKGDYHVSEIGDCEFHSFYPSSASERII